MQKSKKFVTSVLLPHPSLSLPPCLTLSPSLSPILSPPLTAGYKLICFTCFSANCCILFYAVEAEIETRSIFNRIHNRERKKEKDNCKMKAKEKKIKLKHKLN